MIYIMGATSVLGWSLVKQSSKHSLIPFCNTFFNHSRAKTWRRLNLEDKKAYRTLFKKETPQAIIVSGGVCDLEKSEKNPSWAWDVNVKSIEYLLETLPKETRLIYLSSDHVFSGQDQPYTENSPVHPLTVYGRHRVQAENLILKNKSNSLILRYALAIGPSLDGTVGHLDWLRYRATKNLPMTIVLDEIRSVVWADDLAQRILEYTESDIIGLRHITATHGVSRLELAAFLNEKYKIGAKITTESRHQRRVPHLGRVELATLYRDNLGKPLLSPVDIQRPSPPPTPLNVHRGQERTNRKEKIYAKSDMERHGNSRI